MSTTNMDDKLKREEFKSEELRNQDSINLPSPKSDTFFHFVKKLSYLEDIIEGKKFYPRFCEESTEWMNIGISSINIAMRCFCDIPLHLIKKHRKEYGNFCIGMSKKWGYQHNLQPVIYCNHHEGSEICHSIRETFDAVRKIDPQDRSDKEGLLGLFNFFFKYQKCFRGSDPKDEGCYKDFTEENEWRYVPDIDDICVKEKHFTEIIKFIDERDREMYNDALKKEDKFFLELGYEDIKYIIVDKRENLKNIKNFIKQLREKEKIDEEQEILLYTKLLSWDEIEEDL